MEDFLVQTVVRKSATILKLKENEVILEKKIEELNSHESDVLAELHTAKLRGKKVPKKEVELWLKNVQKFKGEVGGIKLRLGEVRPHGVRSWYNLANLLEQKIKAVDELIEKGQFQGELFVELPGNIMIFPTTKLVGETTAERNLKMIEECLMRDGVRKIGVYGMGGVGKTTIMTQIHNKIKTAGTFDDVIWMTVSNENRVEKLQGRVLKALDVHRFQNKDALCRSAELLGYFKERGEKLLLILDDLCSSFSLTKVGIPEPNGENKCKIVWTTRSKKVCRGMGSQMTVKVDCLTKDESWTLFNEKLGDTLIHSPEIEPLAKAIVDKCGGLPLAIVTVGAAMRDVEKISIWRNALEDLKNSRTEHEGLEGVFPCLKFSLDRLKTQRHRDCFLYCALYPEDDKIACGKLIENWIADGFFDEIDEDREKAFDKGYTMLNDLKEACMLEDNETKAGKFVKMHDLLRELAISITNAGKMSRFFVKTGHSMVRFPMDKELMEDVVRISLMSSGIVWQSCQVPNCPKLSTLLLGGCWTLDNIDPLFFQHMKNLRVLDLSRASIFNFQQSLSNLVNLHALHFERCYRLRSVRSVEKLGQLRVLNLSDTNIWYLPHGMNDLTNLRRLDLSGTRQLVTFPVGLLSNFPRLEELLTLHSGWRWSSNATEGRAGVEEIASLTHLRKLIVEMTDLTALSYYARYGNWRNLTCFYIVLNNSVNRSLLFPAPADYNSQARTVTFWYIHESLSSLVAPESTRSLKFNFCHSIPPLSEIPCFWRLKQLESCLIDDTLEMEYVVTQTDKSFLPCLSELEIHSIYNLRTICKEPTQGGYTNLASLKSIIITFCPKLKYVFSVGWLQTLQYLEEIQVSYCDETEEIIAELEDKVEANDNNNITITTPRLKKLDLLDLPQLQSISKRTLICNSLETFTVSRCEQLKKLPLSIDSLSPSLKEMHVCPMKWWESLEWDNPHTKMHLEPFLDIAAGDEEEYADGIGGNATVEDGEGEQEEKDDEDDGGDGENKNTATYDNEEERRGTKRKADRVGLLTWISSYFTFHRASGRE